MTMLRSGPSSSRSACRCCARSSPRDWDQWREVRRRGAEWLVKWEPAPAAGQPDPADDRRAFAARCGARDRERQLGTGYGFGIFVGGRFVGEINLNGVQRGPFQNGYVGYWIDEAVAGQRLHARGCVVLFRFALRGAPPPPAPDLDHPPQRASRPGGGEARPPQRGHAVRYLEINGEWEDHVRYAITAEEWAERKHQLTKEWLL